MTTKLHYDGHGINDATGQRLFTRQRQHADQGGGYVQTAAEARALGELMAAAPAMREALHDAVVELELCAAELESVGRSQSAANAYKRAWDIDAVLSACRELGPPSCA